MATQYMISSSYVANPLSDGHYVGGMGGRNGGFAFRKRVERVDWRKIASIDVEQISRTLDFSSLQENIMNITFCNLEAEMDIRSVDPNFVKLFKLAQLIIEYLLHSQEYLAGLCSSLEEKDKQSDQEGDKLKKEVEDIKKEMEEAKKESHKRKKLLIAQQQLMSAGSDNYKKCPLCSKAFQNESYLQAHIFRRHAVANKEQQGPNSVSPDLGVGSESSQNNVMVELSQLKERLQRQEERALNSMKNKASVHGDHKEEGETAEDGKSSVLMKELREMNAKYQASEKALKEMEVRLGGKRSNLGDMEDEVENEKELLKEQRSEVAELKEQLQQQLDQMSNHMQKNLERQDRKWHKKMHQMTQQHASELRKLNNALESTNRSLDGSQSPHHIKQQQEVADILRQSREQERALEIQEQLIEQEINRASEVKLLRNPHVNGTPKGSARKTGSSHCDAPPKLIDSIIKHSSMYPSDEEEEESIAIGTRTSSLRTIGRDASTMEFTGTQSLRASQFLEELRKNPTLAVMRQELAALLQEHVEKKGIAPDQNGISDQVLENKLAMLRTQRQAPMQKYPNFHEIRNHYNKTATEQAKKHLREQMNSPRGPPPSDLFPHTPGRHSPISQSGVSRPARPRSGPPHPHQHTSLVAPPILRERGSSAPPTPQSQNRWPPAVTQSQPQPQPKPQPQPQPQPRSKTPLSTGSTTEWTSTQFESDEDEEEEESMQVGGKMFTPSPGACLIQDGPVRTSAPNPSPRFQSPKPRLIQSRPINDVADDSDDLDDILESEKENRRGVPSPSGRTASLKQSSGGNVANLRGAIQNQLGNRNASNKPFGGVDIAGSRQGKDNVGNLDEESDWDDTTTPHDPSPEVVLRRPGTRTSADAMSTNTYGTSAWGGSSSKAASTVMDKDRRSTSRSSFVSVTDVSSDEDMNVDNI